MRRFILHRSSICVAITSILGCSASKSTEDVSRAVSAVASSDGLVDATLVLQSDWGVGYCANVTVANKGSRATTSWGMVIALNGSVVNNAWSVQAESGVDSLTVSNLSWNAAIAPAGATNFGFCASGTGRPSVTNVTQVGAIGDGGTGGTSSTGGTSAAGGTTAEGGTSATGGTTAEGGTSATGGTTADGGTSATGGTTAEGGTSATGGTTAEGGTASSVGGSTSTGGSSSTLPPVTPVALHGQLSVEGAKLVDKNGIPYQLKGLSSMWLNWEDTGYAENLEGLLWLRDNWNLSVIRAAMGVEPDGAYLSNPAKATAQVNRIVQNAIDAGVYVIIDWHDHNAQNHTAAAKSFFAEMAAKWGNYPNVLYETFNEPLQVSWSTVLKPYHQAVVSTIRAIDSDNIVILGTPQWSQLVDEAARDRLAGSNLMYTLHFYSCTHGQDLRNRAASAVSEGLPVFLTEWGATHADGGLDGLVCAEEAQRWHDWMNQNAISWAAWKFDDCTPDSTCILKPGAPVTGGFDAWLYGHGSFVRDRMKD